MYADPKPETVRHSHCERAVMQTDAPRPEVFEFLEVERRIAEDWS
jgi:hypothetical protein